MKEEIKNLSQQEMKDHIIKFKDNAFKDAFSKFDQEPDLMEIFLITRYSPPEGDQKTAEFHANISLTKIDLMDLSFGTEQFKLIRGGHVILENVILDKEYAIKLLGSIEYKREQVDLARKFQENAVTDEEKKTAQYMLISIRDTNKYAKILAIKEMEKK